jgi:ribosomal protein S18 acetylase RimI-like enzyme
MLFTVFQEARENNWRYVLLDVRVSNAAVSLYQNLGFRTLIVRKDFYDTQVEDAYFMQLELVEFDFERHYLALVNSHRINQSNHNIQQESLSVG